MPLNLDSKSLFSDYGCELFIAQELESRQAGFLVGMAQVATPTICKHYPAAHGRLALGLSRVTSGTMPANDLIHVAPANDTRLSSACCLAHLDCALHRPTQPVWKRW